MRGSFLIKAKDANVITERGVNAKDNTNHAGAIAASRHSAEALALSSCAGVRAFIIERLLNSPFSRGAVFNVDERTIQVQLEGDEKQVNAFIQNLKKGIIARFGNPMLSFTQFEENSALEVPELMRSSQALVVGQLQKGISVQLDILAALKMLPAELAKAIKQA